MEPRLEAFTGAVFTLPPEDWKPCRAIVCPLVRRSSLRTAGDWMTALELCVAYRSPW